LLLRGTPPVEMPGVPLSSLSRDGVDALWLGPDVWLLLTPEGQGAALAEREVVFLRAALVTIAFNQQLVAGTGGQSGGHR
jgi:sarcosine oxidase gamma subunit